MQHKYKETPLIVTRRKMFKHLLTILQLVQCAQYLLTSDNRYKGFQQKQIRYKKRWVSHRHSGNNVTGIGLKLERSIPGPGGSLLIII